MEVERPRSRIECVPVCRGTAGTCWCIACARLSCGVVPLLYLELGIFDASSYLGDVDIIFLSSGVGEHTVLVRYVLSRS